MPALPTLSDLVRDNQRLELYCRRCPAEVLLPPAVAVEKFGADCTFPEAARRSRCSRCGASGREGYVGARGSIHDMYQARGMTANHAQGEDAWKRPRRPPS